jgi:hypothetical protein
MFTYVKALSQMDRLRIIGELTKQSLSDHELANNLDLPAQEIQRQLLVLSQAGIIRKLREQWSLDEKSVESLSRNQLAGQSRETYTPDASLEPDEKRRKVLSVFLKADGSIKQLPVDPGKLQIILDYLLEAFSSGIIYTEKEVNMIIKQFHIDSAGLRRALIDRGMLERKSDGTQYWRRNERKY